MFISLNGLVCLILLIYVNISKNAKAAKKKDEIHKTHREVCRSKNILCTQTTDSRKKVTTEWSDSEVSRMQ